LPGPKPPAQAPHQIPFVGLGRLSLITVAVIGVIAAFGPADSVAAACQNAHALCSGGADPTRTSVLTVKHCVDAGGGSCGDPVEPNDTDSWNVTATWSTPFTGVPGCSCVDTAAQVAVDVQWTGTAWQATCTGCNVAGPIRGVVVCDVVSCTGGDGPHGAEYRLQVDIDSTNGTAQCGAGVYNLRQVVYAATNIDDGVSWDPDTCDAIQAETPSSQTWSATDTGTFECALSCDNLGATITIRY
jgi:hypothetical protein